MQPETDIEAIAVAAYQVRAALDQLAATHQLDSAVAGQFPEDCCGFSCEVLGQYLIDKGINSCQYVLASSSQNNHAWLQIGGVVIDITGDQFVGQQRPAVYIGAKDAWFDKWARTELEPSGFANDGTKWAQADALEKVTALIIGGTTNPQAEQLETWAGYHSQSEHISALRKVAAGWRATNTEYAGGIVLIWNGRAFGWKDSLRDPHWECPNTLAVDEDGNVYRAEGGDEYYGAKLWAVYG